MKRTLFVLAIVVPAGALVGLLLDSGTRMFGTTPGLARKAGPETPHDAASRPQPVSLAQGSGSELFIERTREVVIGGATVRYATSYAGASSYANAGPGVLAAVDPIMIFNSTPRNEHEVARLLAIDTTRGSKPSRQALEAAFGSRSGIRGRQARIEGASDLSRISRVHFSGNVEVALVDPEIPDAAINLATESLVIDFDGREIVALSTDEPVTVTRQSGNFRLTARGFDAQLREDRARLHHDVAISGLVPGRAGDAPFTMSAPGPVELAFGKRAGKPGSFAMAGSRATATGGVRLAQGDLEAEAVDASLAFDQKGAFERLELARDVKVGNPDGEARGSKLVVTPQSPDQFAELHGAPVTLKPRRGGAVLPSRLGDDVTLTTMGKITISKPVAGPLGNGRTIGIGSLFTVDGPSGKLVADGATIWSSVDPQPKVSYDVVLRRVRAHDDETVVDADEVRVRREGLVAEAEDRITFVGRYDILDRPKPRAARAGSQPPLQPESRPAAAGGFGGGPMRVKGGGQLEIRHPVAAEKPVTVEVTRGFRAESLDRANEKGPPRATLDAGWARLVLVSDGMAAAPGAAPRRVPASFEAKTKVVLDVPDRARARGERLKWDARTRQFLLAGAGPDDVARVDRTRRGAQDWLQAVTLTFNEDILQVIAMQNVEGEVAMQPLPWVGIPAPPKGQTTPTSIRAHRVVANLDGARYAKGEVAVSDVTAELNVKMTQPDRTLTGDSVSFDVLRKQGSGRGSPLRYSVTRKVDSATLAEGIVTSTITIDGDRIVVEGPTEAVFNSKRGLFVERAGKPASRPAAEPLEPVHLNLARRGVFFEDVIVADGRVSIEQRDPQGASNASADSAIVFLDREGPAESRSSRRTVGLAVLQGNAKYRSPDLDAASDVMKLNRVTRHAQLKNERDAKVMLIMKRQVYQSDVVNGVSQLDIDFTDPNDPGVSASNHDIEVVPASRTTPR